MPAATDYAQEPLTSRRDKLANGKPTWIAVVALVAAIVVPTGYVLIWGGKVDGRFETVTAIIDANAADIDDIDDEMRGYPTSYVPRLELEEKLKNIELQVKSVDTKLDSVSEQQKTQTAEIIRLIIAEDKVIE